MPHRWSSASHHPLYCLNPSLFDVFQISHEPLPICSLAGVPLFSHPFLFLLSWASKKKSCFNTCKDVYLYKACHSRLTLKSYNCVPFRSRSRTEASGVRPDPKVKGRGGKLWQERTVPQEHIDRRDEESLRRTAETKG